MTSTGNSQLFLYLATAFISLSNSVTIRNDDNTICYQNSTTNCTVTNSNTSLNCYGVTNMEIVQRCLQDHRPADIVMNNCQLQVLDVSFFTSERLESVTVINSEVISVQGSFPAGNTISKFNLSRSEVSDISGDVLLSLPELRTLDLSHNNLDILPVEISSISNLTEVYLLGNVINCTTMIKLLFNWYTEVGNRTLKNQEHILCTAKQDGWYSNSIILNLRDAFYAKKELDEGCEDVLRHNCTCAYHTFDQNADLRTVASFHVNCSGQNLRNVIPEIPRNTHSLDISNNSMTNLDFLASDRNKFKNIIDLYADDNLISSVFVLTDQLFKFQKISLRRNKLKSIPVDKIDEMLSRNKKLGVILLSGNHFECNCKTAREDKPWFLKRTSTFSDYGEIFCEGSGNRLRLKDIEAKISCQIEEGADMTPYLYILIAVETVLCILLVTRLIYDAYRFRKTGYLPWISAKMPPLPCDCVLESVFSKNNC